MESDNPKRKHKSAIIKPRKSLSTFEDDETNFGKEGEIEVITYYKFWEILSIYKVASPKVQPFDYLANNDFETNTSEMIDGKVIESIKFEYLVKLLQEKIKNYSKTNDKAVKALFIESFVSHAQSIGFDNTKTLLLPLAYNILKQENGVISAFFQKYPQIMEYLIDASQEGYEIFMTKLVPLIDNVYDLKLDRKLMEYVKVCMIAAMKITTSDDDKAKILSIPMRLAQDPGCETQLISLDLLSSLAPLISHDLSENFVVPQILHFSETNDDSILLCLSKIMLSVCKSISPNCFKNRILPVYTALATNKSAEIRKTVCEILPQIASLCSNEITNDDLYTMFLGFTKDKDNLVNYGTLTVFGEFISYLDKERLTEELFNHYIVKVKEFSRTKSHGTNTIPFYKAAYSFPSVLKTYGKAKWPILKKVYMLFIKEKDFHVKQTIVNSFGEVAKLLGPEYAEEDLIDIFDKFMSNNCYELQNHLIRSLPILVSIIPSENKKLKMLEHLNITKNHPEKWRMRKQYSKMLSQFKGVFNDKIIYTEILPISLQLCFDHVHNARVKGVKETSNLLNQLLLSSNQEYKMSAITIIKSFATCCNYHYRILYIFITKKVMIDNREIFYSEFYNLLVNFAFDSVDNLRLTFAKYIAKQWTKRPWMSQEDKWISIVNKLKDDNSKYVREALSDIHPSSDIALKERKNINNIFIGKLEYFREVMKMKIVQLGIDEVNLVPGKK